MPRFDTIRTVPFSAEEMFALVADVEKYPIFVPLCESLVVHSREQHDDGTGLIMATMGIGYKAIREKFTTSVTLDQSAHVIVVQHKNGPFRKLENVWSFTPRLEQAGEQSSDVRFALDYEFSSPLLAVLMGAVFDTAFRKFAEAFEQRAAVVYGTRRPVSVSTT